jgi:hypothetical protein
MPMNVLAVLVFKVRCAPIHQKFHIWTERIEIESGQLAAFGGIIVRRSQVGQNAANPQ